MNVTRGFTGRPRVHNTGLPPGQYDAGDDWPVLSAEVTPELSPAEWTFRVDGLVEEPHTWDWDEAHALPGSVYEGDIHCVTSWSKFGVRFGVSRWTPSSMWSGHMGPPPMSSPTPTPATPPTCRWPT